MKQHDCLDEGSGEFTAPDGRKLKVMFLTVYYFKDTTNEKEITSSIKKITGINHVDVR